MNDHLTERQERILKCIRDWIAQRGETPPVREIGQAVGLSMWHTSSTGWNSLGSLTGACAVREAEASRRRDS
ncbi:LexA family protein [Streptomyces sp. NPDC050564]|uniref:LexA family protein n=1 Tax=Streptomyces sp. NPDC050564 TaxID=3365631 RepID=UPI00378A0D39